MLILGRTPYDKKSSETFYDTDKFVYLIFEDFMKNLIITLYNQLTDSILAYDISEIILENYKKFNVFFFPLRVNDLLDEEYNVSYYSVLVFKEEHIIYEDYFIFKRNLIYTNTGNIDIDIYKFNKKGYYLEKLI